MAAKKRFNQSKNFLYYLGFPFYRLVIIFVLVSSFFFLKIFSLKKIRLPHLRLPHLTLPPVSLPPIHLPRISPPKIRLHPSPVSLSKYLFLFLGTACLVGFIYLQFFRDLPRPEELLNYPSKLTTQILDRHGKLLYKVYQDENRTLITLDTLPDHVKNAFLAAEDKDFYRHKGFSLTGVIRAIYKNIFDSKVEGGSTITQQLIKNTLLSNEKTLTRKIKELILAIEVEYTFSKDKIFEMYLNQVGFGGPAYGIQEASRQYFNLDAKDLNLAQSAFLAGLPQAPSRYSPFGDTPELSLSRQKLVLEQMFKAGMISSSEYQSAIEEKLIFNSAKIEIKAPHFVMYVKDLLIAELGEKTVNQGGLVVTTTLDLDLQEKVQQIVTGEVDKLSSYHVKNGAALVTNPQTGEVLAMVGSKDYFNINEGGQVNITRSLRQPGSSIKPINYALAFENGYSPGSVIEDKPISFHLSGQEPWTPKNYDGKFHGRVSLRQALGSSYNIPSVILLSQNGVSNLASLASKMGISSWNDPSRYGLSMALGSLEVRMTDMATAYSTFANNGITTPLKVITRIDHAGGGQVFLGSCLGQQKDSSSRSTTINAEEDFCSPRRTISSSTAYLITDILSDNNARGPAFGYNSILNLKKAKVAVKTGTSNDLRDNWTFGYNQDYLVSTWVGNNDNSPMSRIASGITGASPIWAKIFNHLLEQKTASSSSGIPDNLVKVGICSLTGSLPCDGCPTRYEYFVKGTEPQTACDPNLIKTILNPSPILPSSSPQIL